MRTFSRSQKGMTLVELMIALVLGLVVTSAVIEIFIGSKQMYRVQDARARLQENGRFAIQFLSNNIRNAGYNGCATRGGSVPITNTLNNSGDFLWDFATGIQGFDATASAAIWSPAIVADITSPLSGSDVLTIRTMNEPVIRVTAHPGGTPPGSAAIQVNTQNQLERFDIVMVTDCLTSAIFQITSANPNTSGSVTHNTGVGAPGNATQALGKDYTGAEIVKLTTKSFYIRNNADGVPSLYQRISNDTAVELVEGIENMQILYGVDTDNDDAVDQYITAATVTNWDNVVSVRVSLLLRTLADNLVVGGAQTYSFNGVAITAADNRLRAVFSRTISLRNRVP
ncbi:pilus assembly protein PilW [Methylophaga sp. 42_25_T18]|nr:pilus assembly protein PilW [Methylophaga sp. 42_25_T18]OUR85528.1 pilus assembly protein PilW [Methylophaga sp. 42_8_T64]